MNIFTRSLVALFFALVTLDAAAQEPTQYPTGVTATTQSGTSVKVDWTASAGANLPSHYLVLIRAVPAGSFTTPTDGTAVANDTDFTDNVLASNITFGTNTVTFTGLNIDTDYEVTIFPYKTGGAPTPDFKTSAGNPTATASTKRPTLTSPTATAILESGATLGGTVTSNNGNALTAKGTVWKTSAGVTASDNQLAEGSTTVNTFTHARTSLPTGTRIYYAAYATNVAGTSLSPEASFYTYSTVPVNQPTISATAVSGSQINLTFTAASANGGATAGYIILRTNNGASPPTSSVQDGVAPGSLVLGVSTLVANITSTSATTFNNTGLTPNTRYYYAVVPYNWDGTNPETINYKVGSGFSTADDATFASSSDIRFQFAPNNDLQYRLYQDNALHASDTTRSQNLGKFRIRDGGASSDNDSKTTRLTSLTISITNPSNLRRVGLYDGNTLIPGTDVPGAASITFDLSAYMGLEAADNGFKIFNVRATYPQAVNDNDRITIKIDGATAAATGSGFAAADAGGAQTSATVNKITVIGQRFRFLSNPSPVARNAPFNLTVRVTDNGSFFNIDKDYNGQVRLSIDGDPVGTVPALVGLGSSTQDPNLVNGVYTWTGLTIKTSGTYELEVGDEDFGGSLSNLPLTITVTSTSSTITVAPPLSMCYGGTFQNLGNIVITETDLAGFEAPGGTFQLALPTGFEFDQTITSSGPTVTGGSDISAPVNYSYPSPNVMQFGFTITGVANLNTITISGLKVRAPHPGTLAPSNISGNITRLGGTAVIAGDVSGTVHGSVSASLGTPPAGGVGFTVAKVTASDVDVSPNETRFAQSSNPVRLVGTPAGGVFSAPQGVTYVPTPGEYRFNPQQLSPGTYVVTYTVKNGAEQCEFVFQKTFEVYITNITGLAAQYCNNAPASSPLSVSSSYITSRYGAGFTFQKFVYWNPSTFTEVDMPTSAGTTVFDPKLATYQPIYSTTASVYGTFGIWIGFSISNGSLTFSEWSLIPVRPSPTPSLSLPKLSFCSDDSPVTLTGTPPNSNSVGDDFFTAAGQPASITTGGNPVVWSFNPQAVTGVTPTNAVSVNITYTYRDPATGCTGVSAPVTVKVNSRPSTVTAAMLSSSTTQNICQGVAVNSFSAISQPNTTFYWYLDDNATQVGIGNTFTPPNPPVNTATPGVTNFYVTRSVEGCESNREPSSPTTPLQIKVNVIQSPAPPTADRALDYCINEAIPNNDLLVTTGSGTIKWYVGSAIAGPVKFTGSNPTASALSIDNSFAGTYTFAVTQTEPVNSCESPVPTLVSVEIKPLPSLNILSSSADLTKICTSGTPITFTGVDNGGPTSAGVWSGVGLTSALVSNSTDGTAVLTTTNLPPNNYTLRYTYTNAENCSNFTTIDLRILPIIVPSIEPLDSCAGVFVRLNNTSQIEAGPLPASTISKTQWNFSDGSGLAMDVSSSLVPFPATNGGRTKGTFFSPEHRFSTTGGFTIAYTMETSDGCRYSATKQLTIHPKPTVDFSWMKPCRDGMSATEFKADEKSTPKINIKDYLWSFNVDNQLTFSAAGTGANPTVNYTNDGRDSVRLIVLSTANCRDTVQRPVFIVPRFQTLTQKNSYVQGFDTGAAGWIDGGANSSWAVGVPNGTVIKGDASASATGRAWDTNLTGISNNREQSWVLSPCFDFTSVSKPIVSLDIWSDTPVLNDGAVLQYNTSGNILDDEDWIVVGAPGQGANWYNETGISSSPGNQTIGNDVGWTGSYASWVKAAFKLDNLTSAPGNTAVVFRIAFASNVPRRDGFAFDNIFIGERTRTVLLENFTNSSAGAGTKNQNEAFNNFSNNSTELAKIQFHTQFPGADILNQENAAINNSRTAFYGITSTGKFALDGKVVNNVVDLVKAYDDRILTPAPMLMKISSEKVDDVVKIKTRLVNITNQELKTNGLTYFAAIVEKKIDDPQFLGTNNAAQFTYVARRMLPDASGTIIAEDVPALDSIELPAVTWSTPGLLDDDEAAIIVFVQMTEGDNKSVIQAAVVDATDIPGITTGVALPEDKSGIQLFPNPTKDIFVIQLPEQARTRYDIQVIDTYGRKALNLKIEKGQQNVTGSSRELAAGMYLVQVQGATGEIFWKKLIVRH